MRISDWSSDVCSSDLQAIAQHGRQHTHEPAVGIVAIAKLAAQARQRRRQIPVLEGRTVPQRSGLAGQHRQIMPRVIDRAVAPEVRSEEHTSELQSLMRISYAVFSLKQKFSSETVQPLLLSAHTLNI